MRSNARLSRCGVFHSVSFLPGISSKSDGFSPEFEGRVRGRATDVSNPGADPCLMKLVFFPTWGRMGFRYSYAS